MYFIYLDYNYPKFLYYGNGKDFNIFKNGIKSNHNSVNLTDIIVTSFYNKIFERFKNLKGLPLNTEFRFFYNGEDIILYDLDRSVFYYEKTLMEYFNIDKNSLLFKTETDDFINGLIKDFKENKISFDDLITNFNPNISINDIIGLYVKDENKNVVDYLKNPNPKSLIFENKNDDFSKHIRSFLLKNVSEIIESDLNIILESTDVKKSKELQYVDIVSDIFNIYMDRYGLDDINDFKNFVSKFLWKDIGYIKNEFISNQVTKNLIESDIKNLEFFKFLINQLKTKKKPNSVLTEKDISILNNFINYVDFLLFEEKTEKDDKKNDKKEFTFEVKTDEKEVKVDDKKEKNKDIEIKIDGDSIQIKDNEKEKLEKKYNKIKEVIKKITKRNIELKSNDSVIVFMGGFNIIDKNFDKLIKETYKNKKIYMFIYDNQNNISDDFLVVSELNKKILETMKKENTNVQEIIYLDVLNIDFIISEIKKRNFGIDKIVFEFKSDYEFFFKYLKNTYNYDLKNEDVRIFDNVSLKKEIKNSISNSDFNEFMKNASEYSSNFFTNIINQYSANVKIS